MRYYDGFKFTDVLGFNSNGAVTSQGLVLQDTALRRVKHPAVLAPGLYSSFVVAYIEPATLYHRTEVDLDLGCITLFSQKDAMLRHKALYLRLRDRHRFPLHWREAYEGVMRTVRQHEYYTVTQESDCWKLSIYTPDSEFPQ